MGVLVQTNFGRPEELVFLGEPVGAWIRPPKAGSDPGAGSIGGSVMVVVATNAPLSSRQLGRLARRASFGLARTGSICHADSGDFVIAFTTAYRVLDPPPPHFEEDRTVLVQESRILNGLFLAVVEATEEAVLNSLTTAYTVVGRDNHTRYGFPWKEVVSHFVRS